MVFNRSHYEDVLVPVVEGWIDAQDDRSGATRQINDFERMLTETGTVVLKFMLHISKDEQRERLQERIDDPGKHWKFEPERPRGAQAVGRLPAGLRRRARRHRARRGRPGRGPGRLARRTAT